VKYKFGDSPGLSTLSRPYLWSKYEGFVLTAGDAFQPALKPNLVNPPSREAVSIDEVSLTSYTAELL